MLTDHDPLCPEYKEVHVPWLCQCGLIARVRADERVKVLADLRRQVEALPTFTESPFRERSVWRNDVLDLLNTGGSDDVQQ